ncbi:flagellar filament capping protein FliD [Paenibacillus prosopidis]|uniref:Flagellar hook-associated protein 2 n=1 Tax=Paenibacillus prosopidis TaxID=630520 RepID=A0A368VSX7_9BACL|nr:flagellar filament capping protein FliD [Paenibacillus prosopidis]RCW44810.1 flagellar hook-associated protein 2 [Paenibacillus prosopidis]
MRISGLASGMDTDEIIKKLMSAHRIPIDKLSQKKQLVEWKRDDYRTLNSKILEFRNAAFDMKLQSSYLTKKVTTSPEGIVSVTASAVTNEGQYTIKINELAKAPSFNSGELLTTNSGSDTIGDLGLSADTTLEIIGVKGSATIDVTTGQTINEFVQAINDESALTGVKASYDSTMDRIFFNSSVTGESSSITLNLAGADDLNDILNTGTPGVPISVTGANAEVLFNDIPAEYESNTFKIADITFTAKEKSATVVNINVTQDVDSTVDTIKNFVAKYNSLIDEVNKELLEKRARSYQPLTNAQREEMSEDEIKKWEDRARSGMLSNDQLLTSGMTTLRRALSDAVGGLPAGQLKTLAEIGISTTNINGSTISGSYSELGKLYINETKLKAAITENPDQVMALFTTDGATESSDGIATRLYDKASNLFGQIKDKAGVSESLESNYLLGKESRRLTDQMSRLTTRLADLENRYYKQFTAMESYINKMNSQSAWLSQQFS